MDRRALDHALEGGRGHGFRAVHIRDQRRQVVVDEIVEVLAQLVQIDIAGAHDAHRIGLVQQGEQQVFKGRKLVPAFIGKRERCVDGLFQRGCKRRHLRLLSVCPAVWTGRPTCTDCHHHIKDWWISPRFKSILRSGEEIIRE